MHSSTFDLTGSYSLARFPAPTEGPGGLTTLVRPALHVRQDENLSLAHVLEEAAVGHHVVEPLVEPGLDADPLVPGHDAPRGHGQSPGSNWGRDVVPRVGVGHLGIVRDVAHVSCTPSPCDSVRCQSRR